MKIKKNLNGIGKMRLFKAYHKVAIIIVFAVFTINSCSNTQPMTGADIYNVDVISELNNWYIIYASQGSVNFKLISEKTEENKRNCKKIKEGKAYRLILHSIKNHPNVKIDGIKLPPINYLDIQCIVVDEDTTVCIESDKGIKDIYVVENLNGLCIN